MASKSASNQNSIICDCRRRLKEIEEFEKIFDERKEQKKIECQEKYKVEEQKFNSFVLENQSKIQTLYDEIKVLREKEDKILQEINSLGKDKEDKEKRREIYASEYHPNKTLINKKIKKIKILKGIENVETQNLRKLNNRTEYFPESEMENYEEYEKLWKEKQNILKFLDE
jgi:hypothetical protein